MYKVMKKNKKEEEEEEEKKKKKKKKKKEEEEDNGGRKNLRLWLVTHGFSANLYDFKYTYLLTPWSIVFLEKLTGSQLVKKFTAFYGTRSFITAFTSAHQRSLS